MNHLEAPRDTRTLSDWFHALIETSFTIERVGSPDLTPGR